MAKTTIKGRFATAADAAAVHQISDVRREWLDREIGKATGTTISRGAKRSGKTARLRAKKK